MTGILLKQLTDAPSLLADSLTVISCTKWLVVNKTAMRNVSSVFSHIPTVDSAPLFAATLTYYTLRFGEFEDFPETSEPVWILGKQYNALTGRTAMTVNELVYKYLTYVDQFVIW